MAWGAALLVLGGCGGRSLAPLPLRPEPIPYVDTLPIPEPAEREELREVRAVLVHGPFQLAEPWDPGQGEALNLTHDDDVVSTAWWERRMGYVPVSPERLARGPTEPGGAPAERGPLVIESVKTEGVTPGFTMTDVKGDTYIVKFDPSDFFHLQSAAGVISSRLMWGAGYHVPEDYITVFDFDRLIIDEDATIELETGVRSLTLDDVRTLLAKTRPLEGERYLALASRYVPGIPKGPFFFVGTREDDPNDHFRHEHRRELRALKVISAWINNTDVREGNTLDVYVDPGYLRHYVIDFGATLGSASTRVKHPKDASEHPVDVYRFLARWVSLGLYNARWERDQPGSIDPALGLLEGEGFDPGEWLPAWTNPAFANMTGADAYWAAKIVASFTDAHIRAAVSEGALQDASTEARLADLLAERRDRTVAYWLARVSPVEDPVVASQGASSLTVSFRDLGLEQSLWAAGETVYDWGFSHPALGRVGAGSAQPRARGGQRLEIGWSEDPPHGDTSGTLATLTLRTRRPGIGPDPARIFLSWEGGEYRVVGITHGDPAR